MLRFDNNPHAYGSQEYHRHERAWEQKQSREDWLNWESQQQSNRSNNNYSSNSSDGGGLLGLAVTITLAILGLGD